MSSIKQTISLLENTIHTMNSDLAKYKQKDNYSEKYVYYKNALIRDLHTIKNDFLAFSEELNAELLNAQKELAKTKKRAFKLEGIIILHGITNVESYLSMEEQQIIELVIKSQKEGWKQLPLYFNTELGPKYSELKRLKNLTIIYDEFKNNNQK